MTFFKLKMLFLIWMIPFLFLIIYLGVRKRQKILTGFSHIKGLSFIAPDMGVKRRWIKAGLVLVAVLLLSIALAGPRYGFKWQTIEQKGVDIMIAIDCSRSMMAPDINPTRLERAKREIFDLLALLKGDRIGLVAFAGTAFVQCPLTLDYDAFHLFLNTLSPDFLPVGGSDMAGAVHAALEGFDETSASEKAIILITDGENTSPQDPVKAAEKAAEKKVKLFCIGVGRTEGVPIPEASGGFKKDLQGKIVLSRLDEGTLKQMAAATHGAYVRSVAGDMDLDAIYTKQIRAKMEGDTHSSGRKQIWEDRFQWPLALAVLCLFLELFLPVGRKNTAAVILAFSLVLMPGITRAGSTQDGARAYVSGDYDQALKHFIDAQLKDPDNAEILYNIGNAYYKKGDFESAAEHYKQALETEKNALKQKALYNLGNAEFKKGDAKKAIENYEAVLEIDAKDQKAKENLDFVKKMMAQQKKQQQENQEKNKDQTSKEKNPGDSGKSNSDRQQKPDAAEKNTPGETPPEYGDEMEKDNPANADTSEKEAAENQNPMMGEKKPADEKKQGMNKHQADKMLNRLKDQPGRAMIPSYRKKHVEKDW